MSSEATPTLDVGRAHRHFSAGCFNRAWSLIEKEKRTSEEDEAMVLCAYAALWHWTQRADCTEQNLSIGHWQLSRVFALLGRGEPSMWHARRSLDLAAGLEPFFVGYGHEAVARAARLLADDATFQTHLNKAREYVATVTDDEDRGALEKDLRELAKGPRAADTRHAQ
jgi:hypothetical protein